MELAFAKEAKMLPQLDYQKEATDSVKYHLEKGIFRQQGVGWTGSGKSSGIALRLPLELEPYVRRQKGGHGGLMFIVHRREIVLSTAQKFKDAYPDKWIGIEMGDRHCTGDEDFIFVSIDSLGTIMSNRIGKYSKRLFGLIVMDESHHVTVGSKWDNLLSFLGVGSDESQRFTLPSGDRPVLVMLTATPNRTDGQGFEPFLDPINGKYEPVFEYNLPYGIRNGWAVDIVAKCLGDRRGRIGKDSEEEIQFVANIVKDMEGPTLVFARSVAQSKMLAKYLREHNIMSAAHVDGTTHTDIRADRIKNFASGEHRLLTNYSVFTEGTDIPTIRNVVLVRPIRSPVDFPQAVGRGTRPDPIVYGLRSVEERLGAIARSSKPDMRLYCLFDETEFQNLNIVAKLTGKGVEGSVEGSMIEIVDKIENVEEEMPDVPLKELKSINDIDILIKEVNPWTQTVYNEKLLALSDLCWVKRGESINLYLPDNPFSTKPYDQVPVILRIEKNGDGYAKKLIEVGGWNKAIGRPRKATVVDKGKVENVKKTVAKLESWLKRKYPGLYRHSVRGGHITPGSNRYLTRNGILHKEDSGAATLKILEYDHRIKTTLNRVGIEDAE